MDRPARGRPRTGRAEGRPFQLRANLYTFAVLFRGGCAGFSARSGPARRQRKSAPAVRAVLKTGDAMLLNDNQVLEIVRHIKSLQGSAFSAEQIHQAIRSYEVRGPDGDGNFLGIVGTYIAMCVDKIRQGRPL